MTGYRRELDGLRAIAIVPVILFHAGFGAFSGGFVGVDVFFVISGYLITSVILTDLKANVFSLPRFYERRLRRICPALFVVMLACWPFAWFWMLPDEMKQFSRSLLAVSLFYSNIVFSKQSGYFDTPADFKPLLHTWTLAVEAQFYFCFPLILFIIRSLGWRKAPWLLLVMGSISLLLGQIELLHDPAKAFFLFSARAWELLLGASVSLYLFDNTSKVIKHKNVCQTLSTLGLILIGYAIFRFDHDTPFPGLYATIPAIGAALIIVFATPQTMVNKLLSYKSMVGIGLISYSAYLWHHPLFAFARLRGAQPGSHLLLELSLASLLLAYVSWRYVEKPFRNSSYMPSRRFVIIMLAFGLATISLGIAGDSTKGFAHYYYTYRLTPAERDVFTLIQKHTGADKVRADKDDGRCMFETDSITPQFLARFRSCRETFGQAIVVLGDSHAINIFNALYDSKFAPFMVGLVSAGCRPHSNRPTCQYDATERFVAGNATAIKVLLFQQAGSYLVRDYLGRVESAEVYSEDRKYSIDYDSISKDASYLSRLARNVHVIWLGPFVEAQFDFREIQKAAADGFLIKDYTLAVFRQLDNALKHYMATYPSPIEYVSLVDTLHIDSAFLRKGDCITYADSNHFSPCGEIIVGERLKSALASLPSLK